MGAAWFADWGFMVDFLVAVRGGWFGMTILLCPVTGVETGGEAVELVGPCGARGLYGELHSRSARILVRESISASRLDRRSSRVLPPGLPLKEASSRGGGGGKCPEPQGMLPGSSRGGGGGGRKSPSQCKHRLPSQGKAGHSGSY